MRPTEQVETAKKENEENFNFLIEKILAKLIKNEKKIISSSKDPKARNEALYLHG